MTSSNHITQIIRYLPNEPGVYCYYSSDKKIIYIGKASNLKKRVSSYFTKNNQHHHKTKKLVKKIVDIQYIVVNTELDALLLENSLIKKNQPKYNILLKDGKNYPYICITREAFPLVFPTRQITDKKNEYYGPYARISMMNTLLELFKQLYSVRNCNYRLSEKTITDKKYKLCLEYHIENCKGPCEGLQTQRDYEADINQIRHILKGNIAIAKQFFKERMKQASENMEYELADEMKRKYELITQFQHRSTVVNPKIFNLEVYTIIAEAQYAYINFMKIINGAIIQTETVQITKKLDESKEDILLYGIFNFREKFENPAEKIISNIYLPIPMEGIISSVPKIGDLKKLINLSLKNAFLFKESKERSRWQGKQSKSYTLLELKSNMNLSVLPRHIECFDNSNIQGIHPVAAVVCFKDGKPVKSEYRKFHIKTVVGADDFSSMYEIVMRRYKRLIKDKKNLPDLVIIDGGKGQLNIACKALKELDIYNRMAIVGIAKKLEEIYFPNDKFPLHINKKSRSLILLQKIRDEAHRFAISFHRNQRSSKFLKTSLEDIPNIGKKTIEKLLKHFKSIEQIKKCSVDQLNKVVGKKRAENILSFYKIRS